MNKYIFLRLCEAAERQYSGKIEYRNIRDRDLYEKYASELLGGHGKMCNDKEILLNGKLIGYIGFSTYRGTKNDDYNKALGIGDFMIIDRNKGYGTLVINNVINKYKSNFDLIYCFVDKDNTNAINFYNRLGKVSDEVNDNNQYYVVLYKR